MKSKLRFGAVYSHFLNCVPVRSGLFANWEFERLFFFGFPKSAAFLIGSILTFQMYFGKLICIVTTKLMCIVATKQQETRAVQLGSSFHHDRGKPEAFTFPASFLLFLALFNNDMESSLILNEALLFI